MAGSLPVSSSTRIVQPYRSAAAAPTGSGTIASSRPQISVVGTVIRDSTSSGIGGAPKSAKSVGKAAATAGVRASARLYARIACHCAPSRVRTPSRSWTQWSHSASWVRPVGSAR
jgi:hypothetical protein